MSNIESSRGAEDADFKFPEIDFNDSESEFNEVSSEEARRTTQLDFATELLAQVEAAGSASDSDPGVLVNLDEISRDLEKMIKLLGDENSADADKLNIFERELMALSSAFTDNTQIEVDTSVLTEAE